MGENNSRKDETAKPISGNSSEQIAADAQNEELSGTVRDIIRKDKGYEKQLLTPGAKEQEAE